MATGLNVTVLGAGAWGSALSCAAARAGHHVRLWARSPATAEEINQKRTNTRYLGNASLEENIIALPDLNEAMSNSNMVLLAIPAQQLETVLDHIPDLPDDSVLVATCKGIDRQSGKLPSQLIGSRFPENPVATLSGPSFAVDLIAGLPTAVTIASRDIETADRVAKAISTDTFRCYSTDDILGVELGGALKNVLALAVGAARGMGLGASAEAALIARGFAEINRLSVKLGAKPETLAGLSGLGDITLTCSSEQSRNFTYGIALGRNQSREGLKLAEGAFTASIALQIAQSEKVDVPITEAIVKVLDNQLTASEAVGQLLTRPLKRET